MALMAGDSPVYEACGVAEERLTTNAIELEALIQGLAYLLRLDLPAVVPVWVDSQYVATTMANLPLLSRNQFQDPNGNMIQNADRINMLFDLWYKMGMHERCLVRKIQGHMGFAGNERADQLSKRAAYKGEIWYRNIPAVINEPETDHGQND